MRNMKNFDKKEFLITLKNKLNNLVVNNTLSVNELFDKFIAILADVVNDFAPIRKATRKEKKLKQEPWITNNLLKCILTKNKMYKDPRVNRNSLDMVESYESYRNVLNRFLRIAKSVYYRRVCENKDHSKKVWKVINELVYSNKRNRLGPSYLTNAAGDSVSDTQEIVETFNELFVNIRKIHHRFFLSG